MVLINEKKYACATCIKGHRVSSCTHTERPLFEVKKKGRPQTQCTHCRERRKGGQAHVKCLCEATCGPKTVPVAKDPIPVTQTTDPNPTVLPAESSAQQTRKGQPGSQATFPNGFKDVHEMAAAADALAGLTGEAATSQERKITSLLNPCNCATTGICRCCGPPSKRGHRPDSQRTPSSETASLSGAVTPVSTDQLLADMLKTKATTGSSSPMSNVGSWLSSSTPQGYMSQSSAHHPTHTNPHVHKTKLYSPYTTPSSARKNVSQSTEPPSRSRSASRSSNRSIRPLANIDTLLTAIFTPDGQAAKSIPRAALGLPGINTLLSQPEGAQPATEDVDMLVDFPTQEPVDLAACTCGEDCECPGCAVHGNENDGQGTPTMAKAGGCCGEGCTSKYDCAKHLSLPSGITSIEHLISLAAANVPAPPDRSRGFGIKLEPNDLSVFPSVHQTALDEDAARSMGVVQLKPLECCNGRCQCPPGECTCMQDCCGCCARCLCEEETVPTASRSTDMVPPTNAAPASTAPSCCSAPPQTTDVPTASSIPVLSPIPQRVLVASPITPGEPLAGSCCKTTANGSAPRRSSSGLRMTQASSRRTSVSTPQGALQRSASTGKSTSKALALHVQPNHPRLILPRPQNMAVKLSVSAATPSTSRSGSPGRLSRVSSPSPSLTSSVSTQPAGPPSLPSTNPSPSDHDDPAIQSSLSANNSADVNMTDADIFACLDQIDQGASYQSFTAAEHPFKPIDIATIEALKQPPLNMLGPFDQPTSGHHPYPQTQSTPQYSAYTPPVPAQYYGLPSSSAPLPQPHAPVSYNPYAATPWQAWQQRQYTAPPPPDPQQQQSPYCPPQSYPSPPDDLIAEVARLVSIGQLPPSVLSLNGGGQGPPLDLRQLLAIQSQNAALAQNPQQFAPQLQQPFQSQQPLAQLQPQAQHHQRPPEQSTAANSFDSAAFDALFQQSMSSSQYAFTPPLESSRPTPGDQTLFGVAEDAFDFEAFLQNTGPV